MPLLNLKSISQLTVSMAIHPVIIAVLLLALSLSAIQLSTCQVVKGQVSCVDCSSHRDLSGIIIQVKCDREEKLATAATQSEGSFEIQLSSDTSKAPSSAPINCLAKLLGGKSQLYASRKNMVSEIIRTHDDSSSYTISTPLAFSTRCPSVSGHCGSISSSKTVDLPLPREWGLAPSSYYIPFFPIIGVP